MLNPIGGAPFIEIFEGRHFQLWKWRMEMILREKGLVNISIGIEQCPIDKTRDFHT